VHIGCYGLNESSAKIVSEISVNFKTKKVQYINLDNPEHSYTMKAFITGNTISFNHKETSTDIIDKKLNIKSISRTTFSWKINRKTLELTTKFRLEIEAGGRPSEPIIHSSSMKCELIKTRDNKI